MNARGREHLNTSHTAVLLIEMVQNSISIPLHSPLYGPPPFGYTMQRELAILCETREKAIRDVVPKPLEYVDNTFCVLIWHQEGVVRHRFHHGAKEKNEVLVFVKAKYKGVVGGHCIYSYIEADEPMAIGRELQGFPKKIATVRLKEQLLDDIVYGTVARHGIDLILATCKLTGKRVEIPDYWHPALQLKVIPKIEGGFDVRQVVAVGRFRGRDTIEYQWRKERGGQASIEFGKSDADPLYTLKPTKVLGGLFRVGSGHVESPCGEVLEDLLK